MGRGCTMSEWSHFKKLPEYGLVPKSHYWYVQCIHCLEAYQQQLLSTPPKKMTGRRSAMSAHLASCPYQSIDITNKDNIPSTNLPSHDQSEMIEKYIAPTTSIVPINTVVSNVSQVRMEDKTHMEAGNDSPSIRRRKRPSSGNPRGRRTMEEWQHFIKKTDKGHIGNSNFFECICRYCQKAYDKYLLEKDTNPLPIVHEPEILVGRREKMRKHLKNCNYFDGDLPAFKSFKENDDALENVSRGSNSPLGMRNREISGTRDTALLQGQKYGNRDEKQTWRVYLIFLYDHGLPLETTLQSSTQYLLSLSGTSTHSLQVIQDHLLPSIYESDLLIQIRAFKTLCNTASNTDTFYDDRIAKTSNENLLLSKLMIWPVTMHFSVVEKCQRHIPLLQVYITSSDLLIPLEESYKLNCSEQTDDPTNFSSEVIEITANGKMSASSVSQYLESQVLLGYNYLQNAGQSNDHGESIGFSPRVLVLPCHPIFKKAKNLLAESKNTLMKHVCLLTDFEDHLHFVLMKWLSCDEVLTVAKAILKFQIDDNDGTNQNFCQEVSPLQSWEQFATFLIKIQDTIGGNVIDANYRNQFLNVSLEKYIDSELLRQVTSIFRVFKQVFDALCTTNSSPNNGSKRCPITNVLQHMHLLYTSTMGFPSVQHALEIVWLEMEQPLMVLGHISSPSYHLRLVNLETSLTTPEAVVSIASTYYKKLCFKVGTPSVSLNEDGQNQSSVGAHVGVTRCLAHDMRNWLSGQLILPDIVFNEIKQSSGYKNQDIPIVQLIKVLNSISIVCRGKQMFYSKTSGAIYTRRLHRELNFIREIWRNQNHSNTLMLNRIHPDNLKLPAEDYILTWITKIKNDVLEAGMTNFDSLEEQFVSPHLSFTSNNNDSKHKNSKKGVKRLDGNNAKTMDLASNGNIADKVRLSDLFNTKKVVSV